MGRLGFPHAGAPLAIALLNGYHYHSEPNSLTKGWYVAIAAYCRNFGKCYNGIGLCEEVTHAAEGDA